MGRQHQGMDRPGVHQVPEGSGEQGKMEKTGCIICGAPTTLVVKGLIVMMMIYMCNGSCSVHVGHRPVHWCSKVSALCNGSCSKGANSVQA